MEISSTAINLPSFSPMNNGSNTNNKNLPATKLAAKQLNSTHAMMLLASTVAIPRVDGITFAALCKITIFTLCGFRKHTQFKGCACK